ncbi:NADH-quinone oxidoreductase subunit K [Nesterenkonia sp. YGD6]|uniref:NADH-quinone oxidoreductase subunit K n=1 Tax=Nesterenkonia sp. YGD6 TaxID=2901231 RepID=UPI001F4C77EA|nr:NADH-quinone oxidoreductase subunit K [Nesterenkonia sp. YGD6]MCH8563429.1 NADH-quinone oxidoreductase subunit K [Nesterenkonia sp. YGD6]
MMPLSVALGMAGVGAINLSQVQWYLLLGTAIAVIGMVRMLLTRDLVARLIALNVTGIGSLMLILALAARTAESGDAAGAGDGTDPVLSALVITGLVITVAFTGLGAVLIRRIEGAQDVEGPADTKDAGDSGHSNGSKDAEAEE